MAGDPPPNMLNAAQIRELLSRIPSRISNPQGDEVYDYRAINTTQGRWGIRDGIWSRDEREALEATFKHFAGYDIDLEQLHRTEYERLDSVMQAGIAQLEQQARAPANAPGAIVSSESTGPRNFTMDKAIIDRVINSLSEHRARGAEMPLGDVANIRALYIAYGMEDAVYGQRTSDLSGRPLGGVTTAPAGRYTPNELNNLGELRRQIIHATRRGFIKRAEAEEAPAARVVPAAVTTEERDDGGIVDPETGVITYPVAPPAEIIVTELPPLETANRTATERSEPPPRMTFTMDGNVTAIYSADVEKMQEAMLMAGYDIGTFPEGHEKAGEAAIDGYEDAQFRALVVKIQGDLKELGIELNPRTTPISQFIETLEDPETQLRLNVLRESREMGLMNAFSSTIDYRDRAAELALSGDGLTTRTAFDDARATTGDGERVVADLNLTDTPKLS